MPDHTQKDVTNNPPGEPTQGEKPQSAPGQPSPGLKDKDAETSNSYGNTRDSGEAGTE
jgi:hypothetical protein